MHLHGAPWENSWAEYRRIAWAAWKKGFKIICFTEHGPRFDHRSPFRSLYLNELDKYFAVLEEIRLEFTDELEVLFGLELDYNERMHEYYQRLLPKLPLDFVFGSLHSLKDWQTELHEDFPFTSLAGNNSRELYEIYFRELENAAKTGLFDAIAHPDYIKKALPHLNMTKPSGLTELYTDSTRVLSACGIAVELNTKGTIYSDVGEYFPDDDFLRACLQAGTPVTIGSDAHDFKMMGFGVEEGILHLKNLGFKQINIWRNRQKHSLDL